MKKVAKESSRDTKDIKDTKRGLYVIRKYIMADSAMDAIRLDKKKSVDDVWLDDESKKQLPSAIGFTIDDNR